MTVCMPSSMELRLSSIEEVMKEQRELMQRIVREREQPQLNETPVQPEAGLVRINTCVS